MATLQEIINSTSKAIAEFEDALPFVEKQLADRVSRIVSQLTLVDGKIKPSVANLRLLSRMRKELQGIVNSSKYNLALGNLENSLSVIDSVNENYFAAMVEEFSPPVVLKEAQSVALEELSIAMRGNGIHAEIVDTMVAQIQADVIGGADFYTMNKSLRDMIVSTEEIPSKFASYTKQVVTDSVHQYNATYHEIVSADLGLEWYEYNGGLVGDSREWCVHMVKKRFIHKSEFPTLLKGIVNGHQCTIYKKTGLPQGMIAGTNKDNLVVNRGGWQCQHLMSVVSEERVPKEIRNKIK